MMDSGIQGINFGLKGKEDKQILEIVDNDSQNQEQEDADAAWNRLVERDFPQVKKDKSVPEQNITPIKQDPDQDFDKQSKVSELLVIGFDNKALKKNPLELRKKSVPTLNLDEPKKLSKLRTMNLLSPKIMDNQF